jgi:hypothetical protein
VRCPRRIAKAGRRLLTTQVSSRTRPALTQELRVWLSAVAGARSEPGRHSHSPPRLAYSLLRQRSHSTGNPVASSCSAPGCQFTPQTHCRLRSPENPVRCGGQSSHAAKPALGLNFPFSQARHVAGFGYCTTYIPRGHVHSLLADTKVGAHTVQLLGEVEPFDGENVPVAQNSHAVLEVPVLYVPARHKTHVLAPGVENVPAGHDAQLLAPCSPENLPARHDWQAVAPSVAECWPAGHIAHSEQFCTAQNLPAEQLVHVEAPASECFPAAHEKHTVRPKLLAYQPLLQFVQNEEPTAVECLPAGHWVQD